MLNSENGNIGANTVTTQSKTARMNAINSKEVVAVRVIVIGMLHVNFVSSSLFYNGVCDCSLFVSTSTSMSWN